MGQVWTRLRVSVGSNSKPVLFRLNCSVLGLKQLNCELIYDQGQFWVRFGSGTSQVWVRSGHRLDPVWLDLGQIRVIFDPGQDQIRVCFESSLDLAQLWFGSGRDGFGSGWVQDWALYFLARFLFVFSETIGTI